MSSNSDKAINITVTVKNGSVIFPDDFDHKVLKKDFQTEIVLDETHFADKDFFHSLSKQKIIELLPSDSRLLVNITLKEQVAEDPAKFVIQGEGPKVTDGGFIEIFLRQPQGLKLRSKKKALLLPCRVDIPALPEQPAASLNHAYTLISEIFEPWRISHTSNVFFKIYAQDKVSGDWIVLDTLRKEAEGKEIMRTRKIPPPEDLFDDQPV
ncbi:MAG TPA: hypothetical protein VGO50_13995 [Pyrinomonadaceae bacterium]|nr:hypothetical protein [Pyrinomonadaceae bacterium]